MEPAYAELIDESPEHIPSSQGFFDPYSQSAPSSPSSLFAQPNDLKVIQEYNRDENIPESIRRSFWGLASKSIKLGFWHEQDLRDIFIHKNLIRVGEIMSRPKHVYTFADRQMMNQMDLLVFADVKRGIGMERYKINERTLQATSVTQSIQGSGSSARRGGMLQGLKNFFA